ncbi:hypothetical protein ACOMHN_066965 [Nucella lapillus]
MNRIASTPNLNLKQESERMLISPLPDNWQHLKMVHAHSVPRLIEESTKPLMGPEINMNVSEGDPAYQSDGGHKLVVGNISSQNMSGDHPLSHRSSSDGVADSYDDEAHSRIRTMSMDSNISLLTDCDDDSVVSFNMHEDGDSDKYQATSRTRAMSIDGVVLGDVETSYTVMKCSLLEEEHYTNSEPEPETNLETTQKHSQAPEGSFFKLERRASFDNGVFGLPDRILNGEVERGSRERNALTAPGTPADCLTPMTRCLSQEKLLQLPEQVFNRIYNLLCAERVTQMTKTYNDIEAVTRLLEEKEHDLELAARIGQTLLSKNKELSCRGDTLDEQLIHANDKINQLKHDLSMKDELLRFYCEDLQDQSPTDGSPNVGPPNLSRLNLGLLQNKVHTLEEENLTLHLESAQLRSDTEACEEKEKKLVEDCLQQLAEVNEQMETFAGELRLKTEESCRHKEEITALLAQVADLHKRVRQLTVENMDLAEKLQASLESQRQLTKQLSGQQDRYDELFEMLEEAQDELRGHRSRNKPKATRHLYVSAALPQGAAAINSLASELQNSMQQVEEERTEQRERRARSWKVFETARAARKAASKSSQDSSSSVRMSTSVTNSLTTSITNSDSESFNSDGYSADMDSIYGSSSELGRPGIPGSNDLESALRRLALRRANDLNERDFLNGQRENRSDCMSSPRGAETPDGLSSPASYYSYLGYSSNNQATPQFRLSDKLQIVKPLEGSVTLRHWQRLAQPHLGGLFERREGVKVKGERKLDLEGEVYTLSDFEEDEDIVECPSRRIEDSSTVYTLTNSVVSHPSERSQDLSELSSKPQPSGWSTPRPVDSKASSGGGSTCTMSLGLAAILQDRGASASTTPSVLRPIASCPLMPPHSTTTTSTTTSTTTVTTSASKLAPCDSSPSGGLFGKLINTGYSLLWSNGDRPLSYSAIPLVSTGASPSFVPPAESDVKSTKSTNTQKSRASAVVGGSPSGVLSTMANFRKNGML